MKSCVGSTWCRYGVQDSVQLAIDLELRYRGLRAPHKIKLAVSGCARECAEAQSKDVGVIATERGWNLYVGGNGGMRPPHAELLAEDLDDETLVRYIDRYLMWYVRTADRLERTATWQRKLAGGIDYVRRVVIDDALGIGAELEADMARHVATYECEWTGDARRPRAAGPLRARSSTPTSPTRRIAYVRDPRPARPGRAPADDASTADGWRRRVCRARPADRPTAASPRSSTARQVAVFLLGDRRAATRSTTVDPFSGASVLSRGIVGDVDGVPDGRVADVQAALRPAHRPLPRRRRRWRVARARSASSTASVEVRSST